VSAGEPIPALQVEALRTQFAVRVRGRRATLTAVRDVSFTVGAGETVALIGESGSGKSTVARSLLQLVRPAAGRMLVGGRPLGVGSSRKRRADYTRIQLVFQDPLESLNPRHTVETVLTEPLKLHSKLDRAQRRARAVEMLEAVELGAEHLTRRPHQLSGGQRQRIGIARALMMEPDVLVLDEPTASLDASTRASVIDLLATVQRQRNIGYLLISHDIDVVRTIAARTLILYLGRVVESGPTDEVFAHPAHPYTRALLDAAPVAVHGRRERTVRLNGEIPSPLDAPPGCVLHSRCPLVQPSCLREPPPMLTFAPGHSAACPVTFAATKP
jgi:oligopeptide/dipeptide ABC transporter ATP-binding protein